MILFRSVISTFSKRKRCHSVLTHPILSSKYLPQKLLELILVLIVDLQTEWLGVNFVDTYFRKGIYPVKEFPAILGTEAAGTIVKLPTDEKVLNDPLYQRLGFQVGGKVVFVSPSFTRTSMAN